MTKFHSSVGESRAGEKYGNLLLSATPQVDPFNRICDFVLDSVTSPHSRRAYLKALEDFFIWYAAEPRGPFTKVIVQAYRNTLENRHHSPSTINVRLAAIRKLALEAADNGLLDPAVAASIEKIRGLPMRGVRAGNWLTREQARTLLVSPDPRTMRGKRDRAILAVLIGCGLRRSEIVALTIDHIQQRDARWVMVDLVGKGRRLRTVPLPTWVKVQLDHWTQDAGITVGKVFRAIDKAGKVWGTGLTEKVIWWTVLEYAKPLGHQKLAPHDLRRTCAKLCRAAGGDLEQIQLLLGHASIQTTERYLGTRQNLTNAVNDNMVSI
jgi:integrase